MARASSSGRDLLGVDAEHVGDRGEQLAGRAGEAQRPLGAAEAGDRLGELGDGVVADEAAIRARPMPWATSRTQMSDFSPVCSR